MISARGLARAAVVAAMLLLAAGAAGADTHAPWPTDWNNWSDPALWVTVGNAGNAADTHGAGYGAVSYTYNMGKFEVTAGQYTAFLNAVAATDTYGLYSEYMWSDTYGCKIQRTDTGSGYTYSVASDWANRPVNFVSWGDAARFANWLTKGQPTGAQNASTTEDGSYYLNGAISSEALLAVVRKGPEQGGRYYIPTEDEWYKAAYHKNDGVTANYFDYPTASDSAPSNLLVDPDPGNNANFIQSGYTIGSPYYRTEVAHSRTAEAPTERSTRAGTSGSGMRRGHTRTCPIAACGAGRSTTSASTNSRGIGTSNTRRSRTTTTGSVSPRFLSRRR